MRSSRRRCWGRIEIAPELILDMIDVGDGRQGPIVKLAPGSEWISEAKAIRCGIKECGNIMLIVEHDSIPSTLPGQLLPLVEIQYEQEAPGNKQLDEDLELEAAMRKDLA